MFRGKVAKKEFLDALKGLFTKKRVLDMDQICAALNTTTRMTAFRYLKKLRYLTSYTHCGRYYTLPEIVQFDPNGFWYFAEIGFSIHGTLINTLHQIIVASESGKSTCELGQYCRIQIQGALRTLLQTQKIARVKPSKPHLYVSADPVVSDQQIKRRAEVGPRQRLPDWIIAEILIETIRGCSSVPTIENIAKRFAKRGSSITQDHVKQVFEEYGLEKKTLG
jgi:hypothetical protein